MVSVSEEPGQLADTSAEIEPKNRKTSATEGKRTRSPVHPIPQLQGPFEESIIDSNFGVENEWIVEIDAQSRRRELLENAEYERLCGRKWRQRAGERYHPLWKLISQTSFGVHLLAKGLAKSEVEVVKILQSHVDEFDGFLERTTDDFRIIQIDVQTRIQYLRLPLGNLDVFDEMLEDRSFRLAIIDYNEKIEFAIGRFTAAVNDSLKDMQKAKEAIGALWHYLKQLANDCPPDSTNLIAIYNAMIGNVEGWNAALSRLYKRGTSLGSALLGLGAAVTEMQRRVGVASRKDVVSFAKSPQTRSRTKSLKERIFDRSSSIPISNPNKPLPGDPGFIDARPRTAIPPETEAERQSRKSVPNLRAAKMPDNQGAVTSKHGRTRSFSDTAENYRPGSAAPKLQRSLSRKLSRGILLKRPASEKLGTAPPERPSTAPPRSLKVRSISIEQLKNNFVSKRSQQRATVEVPALPENPNALQAAAKRDKMKSQLLQYFKSDRVIDAWESSENKEKKYSESPPPRRKDWPLSIFRAKSANGFHASEEPCKHEICVANKMCLCRYNAENQMTWQQQGEADILNTYSLKPKPDATPRIPVLSVHMIYKDILEEQENEDTDEETQSIITALPSIPLHMIAEPPDPPQFPGSSTEGPCCSACG